MGENDGMTVGNIGFDGGRPASVNVGWQLGVLLVLAGCAVGPTFKNPQVTVNDSWRAAGDPRISRQTAADSAWWRAFNDSTLDHLVELAYQQNLPLQIAGLRIVEARAQLAVVTGRLYPQVQAATASATAIGVSQNVVNIPNLPRNFGVYQIGFDAGWELDFWGKYRRGVEAEAATLLGSIASYDSALVSLTAEVARTYVVVRTFEVLIAQTEQNVRVQTEALEIAQSRFRNGATSELDPTQATTLLQSTQASIPQLRTELQQARNALSTLLGQPPGTIDALLAGAKEIPRAPERVFAGVPAEMLRRRPDIRTAELLAAAQCARIGVAKADLYPSFSILGTVGLQASTAPTVSHNLFTPSALAYSVGPRINWPFLNYGRLTNGVRVEDARFQELLVSYRDTVLKAAQEVEDALTGFVNAEATAVFQQAAVVSAGRAMEIALAQYREGAVDYQRVLDAERSLLQQQNGVAQTNSSTVTNAIALYKALGGGWELRQGQPVVPTETQREMKQRTNWGDLLAPPRAPETVENPAGKH
jgi:NodT family efflux transporter outer membrane factor (OMF) lipoprotein